MSGFPMHFIPKNGIYAYLGPSGTNSEEALRLLDIPTENRKPYSTIAEVVSAVDFGECFSGVVPLENSSEGSVFATLNTLSHSDSQIQADIVLDVHHALIVSTDMELMDITSVMSHPQALGQCRSWLLEHLRGVEQVEDNSTAKAVRKACSHHNKHLAAIGSGLAAERYGGKVLYPSIADDSSNQTRFAVIGKGVHKKTGNDKTSLIIIPSEDRPGILDYVTSVFSFRKLNLTKIQSLQVRGQLGRYIFYFDLEGHQEDPEVIRALQVLELDFQVKILGSYPAVQLS